MCLCLGGLSDFFAHSHYTQCPDGVIILNAVGYNLGARLRQLILDELTHVIVEDAAMHDVDRHEDGGNHSNHHDGHENVLCLTGLLGAFEFLAVEVHQPHSAEGGKSDENGVDKEEVEGSEEV